MSATPRKLPWREPFGAHPLDRILARVDKRAGPDKCWPWVGGSLNEGYGCIRLGSSHGRIVLAHRAAWAIANGPIPDGLFVLHHCDNPPCCNPAHLFLGTHQDNMDDMVAKGRQSWKLKSI